jgi:hypothetical protein
MIEKPKIGNGNMNKEWRYRTATYIFNGSKDAQ